MGPGHPDPGGAEVMWRAHLPTPPTRLSPTQPPLSPPPASDLALPESGTPSESDGSGGKTAAARGPDTAPTPPGDSNAGRWVDGATTVADVDISVTTEADDGGGAALTAEPEPGGTGRGRWRHRLVSLKVESNLLLPLPTGGGGRQAMAWWGLWAI